MSQGLAPRQSFAVKQLVRRAPVTSSIKWHYCGNCTCRIVGGQTNARAPPPSMFSSSSCWDGPLRSLFRPPSRRFPLHCSFHSVLCSASPPSSAPPMAISVGSPQLHSPKGQSTFELPRSQRSGGSLQQHKWNAGTCNGLIFIDSTSA